MKIISWNMKQKHDSWRCLLKMDDIDLALLQEAGLRRPRAGCLDVCAVASHA
ncbi:MAG: hypothetical protein OXJ55_12925 [Caldilineaceae bacterium]|nr:hypothetical protein [Caldilineaceae bacterium]